MLQRMTASAAGVGAATAATSVGSMTNEYRLHAALQEGKTIKKYQYVTMEVSGGLSADSNHRANQNFVGTGSRLTAFPQNLHVGGQLPSLPPDGSYFFGLSGSIGEIRGWSTALSASKFRQHTLNKFSTVGNSLNSHKDELIYHYKLNENYTTSSLKSDNVRTRFKYVDSSPTTTYRDYTWTDGDELTAGFRTNKSAYSSSIVYGNDIIDTVQLTTQDNSQKANDNTVVVNPERVAIGNLDAFTPAVESLTNPFGKKPRILTSNKLELYRSPQSFIDDFILDKLCGYDFEKLYGSPLNYYSQSYDEFDTFKKQFYIAHPVTLDTNKFIRAHEDMFNHSLIEVIKKVIPARTTFTDKYGNVGVEIKPTILEKQKYENEKHSVEANPNTGVGSIDVVSVSHVVTSSFESVKQGVVSSIITSSATFEQPKSASISANVINTTTYEQPKQGSINTQPTYAGSTVVTSKDASINHASHLNKSYRSIHKDWGTGVDDTHFINYYYSGSGANDEYNTYHIDDRFVFHTIGDTEYFSASLSDITSSNGASDFNNSNKFYNRLYLSDGVDGQVTYDSKNFGVGDGIVTGRMMGKTRYFTTGSNGNIIFPRNHVSRFVDHFVLNMTKGTKNVNPGVLNVRYEDYSTASFYSVKVTGGENQIIVNSGNPGIGSNDRIIYDDGGGGGAL
jgi:hypothetical protein